MRVGHSALERDIHSKLASGQEVCPVLDWITTQEAAELGNKTYPFFQFETERPSRSGGVTEPAYCRQAEAEPHHEPPL
jgi:hypothetical protein